MDAVIMIEEVHLLDSERVEIREAAHPWQHVRSMGEDIIATEMVFPENHQDHTLTISEPYWQAAIERSA